MTSITLPITTGTADGLAFAHTGPNPVVGLIVYEPTINYATTDEATAAAVTLLQSHILAGYLPTKHSRTGSGD
jgi:hypothetical protein